MINLFSSFDLHFFFGSIWIFFILIFLNFGKQFYYISRILKVFNFLNFNLLKFFLTMKPKAFNKFSHLIFIIIFLVILLTNFFSVFSYNFPFSSQIGVIFFLSLRFWFRLIIFSMLKSYENFLFHLVPEGTPIFLVIFLFIIEFIRNIIRPLTLTVRLVANILAGHLLIILLSILVFKILLIFPLYIILNFIEILVALIQAYIFSTIIVLYFSEI